MHGTFALVTEFLMSIASPPIMFTFYACLVVQTVWVEFVYVRHPINYIYFSCLVLLTLIYCRMATTF